MRNTPPWRPRQKSGVLRSRVRGVSVTVDSRQQQFKKHSSNLFQINEMVPPSSICSALKRVHVDPRVYPVY